MTAGETAPIPKISIDEDATPAQREALEGFEAMAGAFSEAELRSVVALVDRHPDVLNVVLPLTKDPEATDKLFKSWTSIVQTEAHLVAGFDDQTEQAILQDPEFIDLRGRRDRAATDVEAESYRDAIIRFRFVAFGGRLATQQAMGGQNLSPTGTTG